MATTVWLFKPRSHGREKEAARARNEAPLPGRLPSFLRAPSIGVEIGIEDPAQVGDLRGFDGAFGSVRAARGGVNIIESASAELPNAVCAPAATYLVVP